MDQSSNCDASQLSQSSCELGLLNCDLLRNTVKPSLTWPYVLVQDAWQATCVVAVTVAFRLCQ